MCGFGHHAFVLRTPPQLTISQDFLEKFAFFFCSKRSLHLKTKIQYTYALMSEGHFLQQFCNLYNTYPFVWPDIPLNVIKYLNAE